MMKLHKSQTGFSAFHILLLLFLLGIIGFAGWRVYEANHKTAKTYQETQRKNTDTTSQKEVQPTEEYKDWATYRSPLQNFTLRYPKSWKIDSESHPAFNASPDEKATITAPSGLKIYYVLLEYDFNKEFPETYSCGTQSACEVDSVNGIEKFQVKGKGEVWLVKIGTNRTIHDGIYIQKTGYEMALHMPISQKSTPVMGDNKLGQGRDGYNIEYKVKGKNQDWLGLTAVLPESFNNQTPDKVFGSDDSKNAEKILKSLAFN